MSFRTRLGVEGLEAREVPAMLYWTNWDLDNQFDNPANWLNWDTQLPASAAPGAGDHVVFRDDMSTDDCVNFQGPISGAYAGVYLGPIESEGHDYSGTVYVSGAFTTGIMRLRSGSIDQSAEITVSDTFDWFGGTLNSSSYTSTINIFGNGNIVPLNYGTLTTGSTLNFVGATAPTTTTIQPGTVQFSNAAQAVVGAAATVKVEMIASNPSTITGLMQAGAQEITILSGGSLEYRGIGTASTNMKINNEGGLFKLNGQVSVTLTGGNANIPGSGYVQNGVGSNLYIVNGSSLAATNGVGINDGSVFLIMNPDLPASQQTATINGSFWMSGGQILFSSPIAIGSSPSLVYGTFTVNGDVRWTGGQYKLCVDPAQAGVSSKWIVNGTLDVPNGGSAQIAPNYPAGQNPIANSNWTILDANATAGNMPSLPAGSPFTLGQSTVGGRKIWKLSS